MMANRFGRSAGRLAQVRADGKITSSQPQTGVSAAPEYRAMAAMFNGLSMQIGKLADAAAIMEGTTAGQEAGSQAGLQLEKRKIDAKEPPKGLQGRAMRYLLDHGLTRAQAAGVVGNLMAESRLNTTIKGDAGSAVGIAQWRGERLKNLKAWAAKHGAAPDALETQLGFILHELRTSEKPAGSKLLAARTVEEATKAMISFERPRGWQPDAPHLGHNYSGRLKFAKALASDTGGIDISLKAAVPLELRRDGTLRGAAYDKAALAAKSWRDNIAITEALSSAAQNHPDDPEAFEAEVDKIRAVAMDGITDPAALEILQRNIETRALGYRLRVQAKATQKAKEEQSLAASEALDAGHKDLEHLAYSAPPGPDGEAVVLKAYERRMNEIDAAENDGALTPRQAKSRREAALETMVFGRVQGAFDALPDAASKKSYANGLVAEWEKKDEPISRLPLARVRAMAAHLRAQAARAAAEQAAKTRLARAKIKALVRDDLASMRFSGKGLDAADGLTDEAVIDALGQQGYEQWLKKRAAAVSFHDAVTAFVHMSENEIAARLEASRPKEGEAGYADAQREHEALQKEAKRIIKARRSDPARAAIESFPEVAGLSIDDDPKGAIAARLHAQEALGIPPLARAPLTNDEADMLAAPLKAASISPDGGEKEAQRLARDIASKFGEDAQTVMAQVLRRHGISRSAAMMTSAILADLAAGEKPSRKKAARLDKARETQSAERAMGGGRTARKISPTSLAAAFRRAREHKKTFPPVTAAAIQHLRANPGMAAQFDEVFGPGLAEQYLKPSGHDRIITHADGSWTEFDPEHGAAITHHPDGSEEIGPIGEYE